MNINYFNNRYKFALPRKNCPVILSNLKFFVHKTKSQFFFVEIFIGLKADKGNILPFETIRVDCDL